MNPVDIKRALIQRGVFLNRGINLSDAVQKAKGKRLILDPYILEVYCQFNGFQEGALDPGSSIRIWSLEEIFSSFHEGQPHSAFADFLMMSNEYMFDIQNAEAPVLLDCQEIVASSFYEFLRQLVSGHLDF